MNKTLRKRGAYFWTFLGCLCFGLQGVVLARTEKPTWVAEEFYRLLQSKQYTEAAELLSQADLRAIQQLKQKAAQAGKAGKNEQKPPTAETILADMFFLLNGGDNPKMLKKGQDAETIMPKKIGFFVPGQHYMVGNFSLVFTRETYELDRDKTGPVRDDPRKLWVDPTNALSKVRDEAYFKQWWVWENDQLMMPGCLWMVKENREWKIDLLSGVVPRKAFTKILRWHFGREVFEEEKKEAPPKPVPAQAPAAKK